MVLKNLLILLLLIMLIKNTTSEKITTIEKDTTGEKDTTSDGSKFLEVVKKIEELHNPMIDGSPKGTNTTSKFLSIKQKAEEINTKYFKKEYLDAVSGAAKGVLKVVKGIQSSNWVEIVQGSLDFTGSIAGLFGPIGATITTVLSIFSSVVGMFGGPTGKKESQEDMMNRVIKAALEDARHDEIKSEISGAKDLFMTISDTISIFREKDTLTYDQALSFYEVSLQGVRIFGVLEHYIKRWCAVGPVSKDEKKRKKSENDAKYCLVICNLYADLSIYRQILLTDMASVIAKAGLNGTSDIFIELIDKEKQKDGSLFQFFLDPMNYREQRFVVAKYYHEIENYKTLYLYLKELTYIDITYEEKQVLNKFYENPHDTGICSAIKELLKKTKAMVLICNKKELQGKCFQVPFGENCSYIKGSTKDFDDIPNFKKSSIYVSSGFYLEATTETTKLETYNPSFYGPSVYNLNNKLQKLTFYYEGYNKICPSSKVKICEGQYMNMSQPCITLNNRDYVENEMDKIGFTNKVKSLYVPKGVQVTAYSSTTQTAENKIGTFYGPATYMKVFKDDQWSNLKITTLPKKECVIKYCTEPNLGGLCINKETKNWTDYITISTIKYFYKGIIDKINSIQIPASCKVNWRSAYILRDVAYYYGPKTVSQTEDPEGSFKISKY